MKNNLSKKSKIPKCYNKAALKSRGWTDSGIDKFLGEPDHLLQNSMYKTGSPMCYYEAAKVEAIEQTEEWQSWKNKSLKRSAGALKAVKTKTNNLIKEAKEWKPKVKKIPIEQLKKSAIKTYNVYNFRKFNPISEKISSRFN